jgi:Raf kinase inhibitor-like YbhB/YbcL family protein
MDSDGYYISSRLLAVLMACGALVSTQNWAATPLPGGRTMQITSTAIPSGGAIPRQYTCDGNDLSPPLEWGEPPEGTRSFALVAEDPDAPSGMFVHWVLFNLPAETRTLHEGVPSDARLANGARHGRNGWGNQGYGGPCPPGGTHRYYFRLYALDAMLDLPAGATRAQLMKAMEGHILAETDLMGRYARR